MGKTKRGGGLGAVRDKAAVRSARLSVEKHKSDQLVSATVGRQANALREDLATAEPDHPVVKATPPFDVESGAYIGGMKAADVAAVLRALANVVPKRGPSIG